MLEVYETTDLSLAAYLSLKGLKMTIKKDKRVSAFLFEGNGIRDTVDLYYENEGQFLDYSNLLRNIKSRLINT